MSKKYTPDELAHELWHHRLPEFQYEVNRNWLKGVFAMLKIGGIWAWPETQRMFKRTTTMHFTEFDWMEEE